MSKKVYYKTSDGINPDPIKKEFTSITAAWRYYKESEGVENPIGLSVFYKYINETVIYVLRNGDWYSLTPFEEVQKLAETVEQKDKYWIRRLWKSLWIHRGRILWPT